MKVISETRQRRRAPEQETAEHEDSPERVCPNCGATLIESKCELLCPNRQCGYSMSCSDFY